MRIWIRNTAIFHKNLQNCNLGTGTLRKLRICDLQINHYKFANCHLQVAHLRNFAMAKWDQEFAHLRFAD
jgi:uncharacterized protein YjbI with pentapeptide repeats